MFEHSVKVPRPYKLAANIFKKVATEGGSVKSLLYDNKLRHFRTNALFALLTETIKHSSQLDKIFERCSLLQNEPRLDPWLAKVLAAELLFGKKKLPGKSKPEITVSSYKEQFENYVAENQDDLPTEAIRRPRYVRINTNLMTTSDAIGAFQDEEYHFIRCTSGAYDDYLKQIQELKEDEFTQDYHVKTVFVFPTGTRLHEHQLYLENKIVLQDKATTLAVHLLAPPQGSVVMDMCAAPGMKTTQLSAYMRNEGKIYAIERNENRYKTLCDFVERTGAKNVQTIHKDSLDIKKGDYDDVEYILLDPSCSGSGMEFSVHNYIEASRLAKLTSLQEKFLKHAMNSFPKAKRIVYSTCSVFPEENERVVTNTVKVSRSKWRVQDVKELLKGQWNNFGSNMYGSIGVRCLYAKPESDQTIGFFLAVLDRDQKDMEKTNREEDENEDGKEKNEKKSRKKKDKIERDVEEMDDGIESNENDAKQHKSKGIDDSENVDIEEDSVSKKSKKKKDKIGKTGDDMDDAIEYNENKKQKYKGDDSEHVEIEDDSVSKKSIKKKKNKKQDDTSDNEIEQSSQNSNDIVVDENGELDKIKEESRKKKKKRKHETNENGDETLTEVQSEEITEEPIVKKKKNKSKEVENNQDVIDEPEQTEIVSKPKKKKHSKKDKKDIDG